MILRALVVKSCYSSALDTIPATQINERDAQTVLELRKRKKADMLGRNIADQGRMLSNAALPTTSLSRSVPVATPYSYLTSVSVRNGERGKPAPFSTEIIGFEAQA